LRKSLFLFDGLFVSIQQFSLQISIFDEKSTQKDLNQFGSLNVSLPVLINNEQSKSFEISSQQIIMYCGLFGL
jgi:hypothetical protein